MPSPLLPSQVRDLIPGPTGNFCEKFLTSLGTPAAFHRFYAWMVDESGEFTPEFVAMLCATQCFGGDGTGGGVVPPGGLAAPTGLMASDGEYSDRVQLAWVSVVTADGYDIYRSLTNDSASATIIASVGQTTQYTDTGVEQGQTYWYWVRAKKAAIVSALSGPDSGYSAGEVDSVTDLKVSRGFYGSAGSMPSSTVGSLALVFTAAAAPANAYDVYRGTVDDFDAATTTKIDSDRMPFDNARSNALCSPTPCTKPLFVNNGDELVYRDTPPNAFQKYFYWVVAKQISGANVTAIATESNSAFGWVSGDGALGAGSYGDDFISTGSIGTVPPGVTKAWIVLHGRGGGGAGGDGFFGGGGGGGQPIIAGLLTVVPGAHIKFVHVTRASGGAGGADGEDGPTTQLQYDGSGAYVTVFETGAAGGGKWNPAGGGLGGAGATAFVVNGTGLTNVQTEPGRSGTAGVGAMGGRGGSFFGWFRSSASHLNGALTTSSGELRQAGGGGSDAIPTAPSAATGGNGNPGLMIVKYY